MKYLLFFTALITTANALECHCSEPLCEEATCTVEGGYCYSTGMEIATGSDKMTEMVKGCLSHGPCHPESIRVTMNSENHFWTTSSCCQEDLCNNKLDASPENTTLNGLSCPACFNLGSDQCDVIDSLNCIGEDNHCITLSGTMMTGGVPVTFASRGCSSASACALPVDTNIYSAGITFHLQKIGCSPAVRANST